MPLINEPRKIAIISGKASTQNMPHLSRHNSRRSLNLPNPRRTAEEFLELLRGYAHLRMLLGVQKTLSAREAEASIDGAVQHILGAR